MTVVIDDRLPVSEDGLLLSASSSDDKLWIPLLEKAVSPYLPLLSFYCALSIENAAISASSCMARATPLTARESRC